MCIRDRDSSMRRRSRQHEERPASKKGGKHRAKKGMSVDNRSYAYHECSQSCQDRWKLGVCEAVVEVQRVEGRAMAEDRVEDKGKGDKTKEKKIHVKSQQEIYDCLLYTSDAADDLLCVDLGGRRIIKKKNAVACNKSRI
eukprot:TRINITY_DN4205_c0_g1_i1.p1 TRINITY_DN4205_c0_g1~~TRINITY_DN4205_c0_g1_i1.p1  ORF type:complete len:140 (+),score=42.03 TRINITY_DN4205_c0_g1_i1:137-556(+)